MIKNQKHMIQNVAWNTFGSIFYYFCQWLTTILVVRFGSFELSGYYALALTTSSSFAAIASFSMRNYQVSDIKEQFSNREYMGSRFFSSFISMFLCFGFVLLTVSNGIQRQYIYLLMIFRILEAFVDVIQGIEQRFDRYDLIGISFFIRGFIIVGTFFGGLIFTNNLTITLLLMIGLTLFEIIVFDIIKIKKITVVKPVFSKQIFKLMWICVPLVVFSFLFNMENSIPKTILENLYGAELLGIYSSMASPTLIVQVAASVVFMPFLPMLTKEFFDGEKKEFVSAMNKIFIALIGFSFLVTVFAILLGKWGLSLLFGTTILDYYCLFMPIVWVTILTAFSWIFSALVIAIREIKKLVIGIVLDFIICCLITYPFVKYFGANGVSFVNIISLAVLVIYMVIIVFSSSKKQL